MVDRRGLLAGAAAFAVAGCGTSASEDEPGGSPPERSVTSRQGDVELLQAALAMELAGRDAIDRDHADTLREALRARDAEPTTAASAQPADPGRAIAFYLDALPKIYDEKLRSTLASILVVEAQRLAEQRARDGERPAPDAFVYGFQPS